MKTAFLDKGHDHGDCIQAALNAAEVVCQKQKARLTPIRRRVLELVWRGHAPVGAYELLQILKDEGFNPAPPTVYRALDFLIQHGLVHRISSLNAFVGCSRPGDVHDGTFLICRTCGTAAEMLDQTVLGTIGDMALSNKFSLSHVSVEAVGVCVDCRDGDRTEV